MTTSRRRFLKSGVMAGLFASVCLDSLMPATGQKGTEKTPKRPEKKAASTLIPDKAKMNEVFYFTKSTFDPYLNTEFRVRTAKVTTRLTLVEVMDFNAEAASRGSKRSVKGESFLLVFKADKQLPKGVTILNLEHDALGKFELFLGNWKKWSDPRGIYYQAVINHTQPSSF